jgi:excisionase family DNA binding protein
MSTQTNARIRPPAGSVLPSLKPKPTRTSTPPDSRPDAWRVNDALRQLSISRATLYKLIGSGEIRLVKIGGRSLIPDSEIRRLIGEAA